MKVGAGSTAQAVAGRPAAEECEALTEPRACQQRPGLATMEVGAGATAIRLLAHIEVLPPRSVPEPDEPCAHDAGGSSVLQCDNSSWNATLDRSAADLTP